MMTARGRIPRATEYSMQTFVGIVGRDSIRPTLFFLNLADYLFGLLLVLGAGTATTIAQFAPPVLVGWSLLAIGSTKVVGLVAELLWVLLVTTFCSFWLWAALLVIALTQGTSTGAIVTFAVLTAMSGWVWFRVLFGLVVHRTATEGE